MVTTRFTRLIIGFLFALFVLRDSLAHEQKAPEVKMVVIENGHKGTRGTILSFNQDIFDGVPNVAATRNNKLGGRKMVVNDVLRKEMMMKEGGLNQKISKISGKGKNTSDKSIGGSQRSVNHQHNNKKLEPKTLNPAWYRLPLSEPLDISNTNQLNSQDSEGISSCGRCECSSSSKKTASHEESNDPFQKIESKRLLEATNEIVNLMHKDYKGMANPRRKPPINNYNPLDEDDVKP